MISGMDVSRSERQQRRWERAAQIEEEKRMEAAQIEEEKRMDPFLHTYSRVSECLEKLCRLSSAIEEVAEEARITTWVADPPSDEEAPQREQQPAQVDGNSPVRRPRRSKARTKFPRRLEGESVDDFANQLLHEVYAIQRNSGQEGRKIAYIRASIGLAMRC